MSFPQCREHVIYENLIYLAFDAFFFHFFESADASDSRVRTFFRKKSSSSARAKTRKRIFFGLAGTRLTDCFSYRVCLVEGNGEYEFIFGHMLSKKIDASEYKDNS